MGGRNRPEVHLALRHPLERTRHWFRGLRPVEHHEPLGRALLDHLEGRPDRVIEVSRSDGVSYTIDRREFFSVEGPLQALDTRALGEARGRVLDIGAGAGRHTLALEKLGLEVVAIDVSPLCVDIMRRRGVGDARRVDAFELRREDQGVFDTVLLLMQSAGIAGSVFGFERLLISLRPLLRPGAQILLDSSPPLGQPVGSNAVSDGIDVRFSYDGYRGESFSWLYLDQASLAGVARDLEWNCEILERVEGGEYLARLQPPSP